MTVPDRLRVRAAFLREHAPADEAGDIDREAADLLDLLADCHDKLDECCCIPFAETRALLARIDAQC